MIDHVWTVVCSKSVVDQESNNITLMDVVEQINAAVAVPPEAGGEQPTVLPFNFEVVTLWSRADLETPITGRARVLLIAPSGQQHESMPEYEINLVDHKRFRGRIKAQGLPADTSGVVRFRVQLRIGDEEEWHDAANIPVQINLTVQQQPPDSN